MYVGAIGGAETLGAGIDRIPGATGIDGTAAGGTENGVGAVMEEEVLVATGMMLLACAVGVKMVGCSVGAATTGLVELSGFAKSVVDA